MADAFAMNGIKLRERAVITAVMAAMALAVLDAGLVNVALPTIAQSLNVAPSHAILTVSVYQTALVIGLLPSAHIAERIGYRKVFVGGLALFSVASIFCGLASSLPVLVTARALQGLGGAAVMALGVAILRFALGTERLGMAIGWNALNVALCSAAGPILGAAILSVAPWPWLFFTKLPLIAIALAASFALPELVPTRRSIDYVGMALHGSIAAAFVCAAGMAMERPFLALMFIGGAIVVTVVMASRERSRENPIWPLDLLGRRAFRMSIVASICCFVAQSAGILALPFYLQVGLGYGPASAAAIMTSWPLTVAATSSFANRLAQRFGSARLCATGGLVLGAGLILSALWPVEDNIVPLAVGSALSGLGFGLFQVPNNRTMFLSAPPERSAAAGGMQGSARLIGQTVGALAIGLLLAGTPTLIASRLALALGGAFATAAAFISAIEILAQSRAPQRAQTDRPHDSPEAHIPISYRENRTDSEAISVELKEIPFAQTHWLGR